VSRAQSTVVIPRSPWVPCLALCFSIAVGCGSEPAPTIELEVFPAPALISDSVARNQIEERYRRVVDLVETGAASDSTELGEALGELAQIYHAYDLLDAAAAGYEQATMLDPDDYRWPYLAGYLHQGRGELERAAASYERAAKLQPAELPLLVRRGELELARHRLDAATLLFEQASALAPRAAVVAVGLGRVALERGDAQTAIAQLERALELEPAASEAHYPLGLAYREAGDHERAAHHLSQRGAGRARLDDPPIARLQLLAAGGDAPVRLGLAALAAGDNARATQHLRAAVAARPDDLEARRGLAVALAESGDLGAAEEQYRELVARHPEDAAAHLSLGNLVARKGALEEAVGWFRAAVALAPDFDQAHFNLASALLQLGHADQAVIAYDRVLALDPNDGEAAVERALALAQAGREGEASIALHDQLARSPANARARTALAALERRMGDLVGARQTLEAGLRNPIDDDGEVLLRLELARLLLAQDRPEAALAELDLAARKAPDLLDLALESSRALSALERFEEAAARLGAVTAARPELAGAWLAQAEAWRRAGKQVEARSSLETAHHRLAADTDITDALARLLATAPETTVRDQERALALADGLYRARRLPRHAETLAMALARLGRFEEALELQQALVESASRSEIDASWRDRLERNLRRYREQSPAVF
jgi:tetratricopeptide (TPR) repeat protein